MNIKNMKFSTLVTVILIIFTAAYFVYSFQYDYWSGYGPGAAFMPRWASGIMLALLFLSLFKSLKKQGPKVSEAFPKGFGRKNNIIAWLCLIFFVLFSKKIGVLITSIIILTILFGINTKWYKALALAVVVSICCFFVFSVILEVPVPTNKFGW